ncbi:MAG TPA: hypothetical protein VGF50_01555 [Caulobacteraceae bacterium]
MRQQSFRLKLERDRPRYELDDVEPPLAALAAQALARVAERAKRRR